jgi:ABC-2 type transport system permease protein
MNKIALILSREYFVRVRKKSFLITTIIVPLVIMAFYAVIIYLSTRKSNEINKIAVIDNANIFNGKIIPNEKTLLFTLIKNEKESAFVKKYKEKGFNAFLFISGDTTQKSIYQLHSQSSLSLSTMESIEDLINSTLRNKELIANGINPKEFDKLNNAVKIENTIDTEEGSKKGFAEISYIVSFACGLLIYIMMMSYGTQVMRGVAEEKTNRISEVIVSSVRPFQLMMGKILGIGAVGLTQFIIWMILILTMQMAIPLLFPDVMNHMNNASQISNENVSMLSETLQGISSLPIGKIIFFFLFYFLLGYLTYASIFAAIGSVASEDQQEAQQLVLPVLMPIILGFVIMTNAVDNPNSTIAVFASIFPLTSPIVMMGRITYDIPFWQMALSMSLLIFSFIFFTWIAGKIYRIGILMYGKKISWKEMIKWAFVKS